MYGISGISDFLLQYIVTDNQTVVKILRQTGFSYRYFFTGKDLHPNAQLTSLTHSQLFTYLASLLGRAKSFWPGFIFHEKSTEQ